MAIKRIYEVRCFFKEEKGKWVGVCIDFNVSVQSNSPYNVIRKLNEALDHYVETPIPLKQKVLVSNIIQYYFFKIFTYDTVVASVEAR
jgi:hypothetical protein